MKELLLISGVGMLSLIAGLLNIRKIFKVSVFLILIGVLISCAMDWNSNEVVFGMLLMDNFALSFLAVIIILAFLWFLSSGEFFNKSHNFSDHYSLILFSLTGALLLVSYNNLVMLFLGIEILSIPTFVMVGSHRSDLKSNEASFKYFLLGAFASAILLMGITLVYGAIGSFDMTAISQAIQNGAADPVLLNTGIILLMAALAFKVSVAPFHLWTPDVYQGAPIQVTAFMSTIVKTAAFAAFYRLFAQFFTGTESTWLMFFAVIASLSVLWANLSAVVQTNSKRILAYSSVSHAGFMLVTLFTVENNTANILLYYTLVYGIASLITFNVVKWVSFAKEGQESLALFAQLFKRNKLLGFSMMVAILYMAGIPPMAGFIAKYMIFATAIASGYLWVTIVGIIASLIAVYYYFRIIVSIFDTSLEIEKIIITKNQRVFLIVCCAALVALTLFPRYILSLI
ncbi:MAG: NADH-quinone oxidoreductase subunit N [Saprospiraceae bacterium]|nr:NADH-quinone oxidoreductase subunit N [Saprospiraceae bacterium]